MDSNNQMQEESGIIIVNDNGGSDARKPSIEQIDDSGNAVDQNDTSQP